MKILVVGQGGREHAICRALANDRATLIAAPGNPGIAAHARCIDVKVDDVEGLVNLAKAQGVHLVVPGPEASLVAGLADGLKAVGVPCCGPSRAAAQLEGSKAFMREIAWVAGVPSPAFRIVRSLAEIETALEDLPGLPVVKADGLAAGKGVVLPDTREECVAVIYDYLGGTLGRAGRTVVLEERLTGIEASLFYACDGENLVALPHARDHKRAYDGDRGPNTGGMGAVSPNPVIDAVREQRVREEIVLPVVRELKSRDIPYVGFLYAGVMIQPDGDIKLLEFNARLGDPEAQAILPRLGKGELSRLCAATAAGKLGDFKLVVDRRSTVSVVLCADGYPGEVRKGDQITIDPALTASDRWLDHAGTKKDGDNLVTSSGRVATVVACATTLREARSRAYEGAQLVRFGGMHYRRDIGEGDGAQEATREAT